ncbi:cutinase family protein [Nocardia gamkensis]|uniref:Cutinase family protein n=1 Tax=Nocardia gamkensis TaxID=352869 RepID=A0A7X6L202_9NOCA|nr:cutinase family protein [Nocardia gamkensis]NKY26237.1 cutinase family protein [Nocardia gamkensis]NQE72618.1 Cutinase [Nocardia gamkensis]
MTGLRLLTATVLAACTSALYASGSGSAQPSAAGPGCPVLWVLGVQGTGESSPGASPVEDTGMLGFLLGPVVAAVPDLVARTYIAYPAGFGGAVGTGGGPDSYAASMGEGLSALTATAERIAADCPGTALAVVGYSQGAQVVSEFARDVGAGEGPVSAERVAGIALYSDPDRAPGSPVIPGRPGQLTPDPAPGTSGAAVSGVAITTAPASGGGIATGESAEYGALTGRVADICVEGDLSCSAPDRAALLRVAAQVAAQADLRDPVAALGSIQALLSGVLGDAWTTVVNNDFLIGPGVVDYVPAASPADRLTDASDPRTPSASLDDRASATARWGQITRVVVADPVGQLPKLAGQLSAAWGQLVGDNADLLDPAVWLRYADIHGRHTGYAATGQLASGIAWMTALAYDLAGSHR